MKPIPEMTDAELNEAMAVEVMGWTDYRVEWLPATDLNQAWECVGRWLKENQLGAFLDFGEILEGIVLGAEEENAYSPRVVAHATAKQRCEALLMAVRGEK